MYQGQKPAQFCSLRRRPAQRRDSLPANERINSPELVAVALEIGWSFASVRSGIKWGIGSHLSEGYSSFSFPHFRSLWRVGEVERPRKSICGANGLNRDRSGFSPAQVFSTSEVSLTPDKSCGHLGSGTALAPITSDSPCDQPSFYEHAHKHTAR